MSAHLDREGRYTTRGEPILGHEQPVPGDGPDGELTDTDIREMLHSLTGFCVCAEFHKFLVLLEGLHLREIGLEGCHQALAQKVWGFRAAYLRAAHGPWN